MFLPRSFSLHLTAFASVATKSSYSCVFPSFTIFLVFDLRHVKAFI